MSDLPAGPFTQRTLKRPVSTGGVGIHSGRLIQIHLRPAPPDSGVVFRRTDSGGVEIPARASEVSSLELATTIGRDDVTVSTVEHLLAAIRSLDIDNVMVELDGPEVPILDGSALPFVRLLEAAGVEMQPAPRRILAVTSPVEIHDNGRLIRISPYPGFRIRYTIDFPDTPIAHQTIDLEVDPKRFVEELAPARTFALWEHVRQLQERGFGLGGEADNCLVFDQRGPRNGALRFENEPVRHKALDAIGDLALMGCPIWGFLEVERGGHSLHFALLEELERRPESWSWISGEQAPKARRPKPAPSQRVATPVLSSPRRQD